MARPRRTALTTETALELAARVRAGEVSAVELVEEAIARCEQSNPTLNFLVAECFEHALAGARRPLPDGPFTGVPMLVKDLTETAGLRTTFSSRAFADYVPKQDAAVVRRLKDAGFVVIGKTNTPEFGITAVTESDLNGACRNPWNPERTPGGSSGGAAAAVAAGVLPLAHGSDGGGSLRIPASCCGLFALKPSRGRVSPAPLGSGSLELSQSGPLAHSVRDAAAFLDVVAGYEPGDAHWPPPPERPFREECELEPGRLRIALTVEPPIAVEVEPDVANVARAAADALAALGHDVVEATPPWRDDRLLDLFGFLWQLTPALYPVRDPSLLMPLNRYLLERAHATSSVEHARAVAGLQQIARRVVAFWSEVDVVLTPGLAKLPVPVGWIFEPDDPREQFRRGGELTPFTPLVNVTGQPAATVPLAVVDGLPVGVQLIGPPAGEAVLIRLAAQLEAAHPWRRRSPSQ
ncbi:MAG TPA: amidase [Gaiellaceae bacterium]|nr:amidase [Gaiellaceae bacterium]